MINYLIKNKNCKECYWCDKCGGDNGGLACDDFTPIEEYGDNHIDFLIECNRKKWHEDWVNYLEVGDS